MLTIVNVCIVIMIASFVVSLITPFLSVKRVGGLYHWRIGRVGGSFYLAKAKPKARRIKERRMFKRFPSYGWSIRGFGVDPVAVDPVATALRRRMLFALRSPRLAYAFA